MWWVYALLSALFASLTAILAKIGIEGINSNLATAIRTIIVLAFAWFIVFLTGAQRGIDTLTKKTLIFLVLSGLATGISWLFYFKAIQIGPVSKVASIDKLSIVLTMLLAFLVLGETPDVKTILGGLLIAAGAVVLIL